MSESTVRSFDQITILRQFFGVIFGEQKGWSYTATKDPQEDGQGDWEKKFFRYPDQLEDMINFIVISSAEKEVYYSPALYKNDRSDPKDKLTKEDFLGSSFIWADFDGRVPNPNKEEDKEKLAAVPSPTMKIQSSNKDRQHWYWNLNFFETNPDDLEKLTRALTYHLGADLSGWDYQQVLRPPGTIHHKTDKTVKILSQIDSKVSIQAFMDIPDVPDYVWDVEIDETKLDKIPAIKTLLIHKVPENDADLILKKEQPVGKRSSALTRVGYVCAEAGMNNTEIFSILKNCDMRWKKFAPRGELSQKRNLIGVIRYVRQKYPLNIDGDLEDELPYYTFGEFASMDLRVEWIVDGLIQKNGTPVITGLGGSFKTHMTFNLACHMVVGKKFLHWEFARPMKLCIVSNELAPAETKEELDKIVTTLFTLEEQAIIRKNLHIIPLGSRLALNKKAAQDKLLRRLEAYTPEGLFFDSLGQSIDASPNSDEVINDVFEFMKRRVNQYYDAFSWFIHHMRKEQVQNKKPRNPSDVYGSAYIFNNASLVLNLWKNSPTDITVEADYLKVRFAKPPPSFKMKRLDPCGFEIVPNSYTDLSLPKGFGNDTNFGSIDI